MSTGLVTGASRGIGLAIVRRLAQDGWDVMGVARDERALQAAVAGLEAEGLQAAWGRCDVADEASVAEAMDEVRGRFGCPDLLVNCAGIPGSTVRTSDVTRVEWDEVLAVNLTGPLLCAQAVLPAMVERGSGHIVNIASITGKRPLSQRAAYAASKLGLIGLTRTLAAEVGPYGVRVNAISPGVVAGERIEVVLVGQAAARGLSIEEVRAEFMASTPMGRAVRPEEVADAVVSLHQLSAVTGVDFNVAAGLVMY